MKTDKLNKVFETTVAPLQTKLAGFRTLDDEIDYLKTCVSFSWKYREHYDLTKISIPSDYDDTIKQKLDNKFLEKQDKGANEFVEKVITEKGGNMATSFHESLYCDSCKLISDKVTSEIKPLKIDENLQKLNKKSGIWLALIVGVAGSFIASVLFALLPGWMVRINPEGTREKLREYDERKLEEQKDNQTNQEGTVDFNDGLQMSKSVKGK